MSFGHRSHRLSLTVAVRHVILVCIVMCSAGPSWSATEDAAAFLERRVKVALLYRFINYAEWPQSAFASRSAPFTIAIAGAEALGSELADFTAGRTVLDRPLAVRKLERSDAAKDVHLVFVGRDEAARLPTILRAVPQNVLVVTEWDNALDQGSVINFLLVDGQVRFEVSLDTAQKRGIRLSSRLLSVAHHVQP